MRDNNECYMYRNGTLSLVHTDTLVSCAHWRTYLHRSSFKIFRSRLSVGMAGVYVHFQQEIKIVFHVRKQPIPGRRNLTVKHPVTLTCHKKKTSVADL